MQASNLVPNTTAETCCIGVAGYHQVSWRRASRANRLDARLNYYQCSSSLRLCPRPLVVGRPGPQTKSTPHQLPTPELRTCGLQSDQHNQICPVPLAVFDLFVPSSHRRWFAHNLCASTYPTIDSGRTGCRVARDTSFTLPTRLRVVRTSIKCSHLCSLT